MKDVVCTVCPIGCKMKVEKSNEEYVVTGNSCDRGIEYGINETINPVRVLTTTVKLIDSEDKMLPVRTEKAIPKNKIFECIKLLNKVKVKPPINIGEVIVENILGMGINVISSKDIR